MSDSETPVFLGIDFGTSNSSASVNLDGVVRLIDVDPYNSLNKKVLRSVIYYDDEERRFFVGQEAIDMYIENDAWGRYIQSIKSFLSDSILMVVDCSKIDRRMQEDLFMNSRDRLGGGPLQNEIEKQLEDVIRNHQGLRALRSQRRQEDIKDKLQDSKPLADVLENIIKKSPSLTSLFLHGTRIKNPFKLDDVKEQGGFDGKEFPTYFKLSKDYSQKNPKSCPVNRRFRIQYETDAKNDYFNRDKEPGDLVLEIKGSPIKDYSLNLWNGLATLTISLPQDVKVGDKLCFQVKVSDITRVEPFLSEFFIKIDHLQKNTENGGGKRKRSLNNDEGHDRQSSSYLDIPTVIRVRKDEWEEYKFKQDSALLVKDAAEEGYVFFINMDNVYLQTEIKGSAKIDPKLLEARFEYGMVLLGISLLDFEEKRKKDDGLVQKNDEMSIYDRISFFTKAISPTLLPMISSLGQLVEIDD